MSCKALAFAGDQGEYRRNWSLIFAELLKFSFILKKRMSTFQKIVSVTCTSERVPRYLALVAGYLAARHMLSLMVFFLFGMQVSTFTASQLS